MIENGTAVLTDDILDTCITIATHNNDTQCNSCFHVDLVLEDIWKETDVDVTVVTKHQLCVEPYTIVQWQDEHSKLLCQNCFYLLYVRWVVKIPPGEGAIILQGQWKRFYAKSRVRQRGWSLTVKIGRKFFTHPSGQRKCSFMCKTTVSPIFISVAVHRG